MQQVVVHSADMHLQDASSVRYVKSFFVSQFDLIQLTPEEPSRCITAEYDSV